MHEIILGVDNCGKSCMDFAGLNSCLPWFMYIHDYSCLLYSSIFMMQFYYYEYSRYKTGIIHEYSRIYTMDIHELF